MLTQKPAAAAAPRAAGAPADLASLVCLFEGRYVPLGEANVSIMTHAFMYGTAVFEGIRAYWNEEQQELHVLFVREHMERIRNSAKMLLMENLPPVDELVEIVLETVRRNGFREDVYIRPSFYKSTRAIGVRLHHLEHQLYVIVTPFGNYVDIEHGIRVMSSSWRYSMIVVYICLVLLRIWEAGRVGVISFSFLLCHSSSSRFLQFIIRLGKND